MAKNQSAFEAAFGVLPTVLYSSTVDVNGDDVLALEFNGVVYDVFGVIGVDGSGEIWEYENSCAVRAAGASATPTFTASEWTINSDTSTATPGQ